MTPSDRPDSGSAGSEGSGIYTGPVERYGEVDRTPDPSAFVRHLETAGRSPTVRAQKATSYAFLDPQPGDRVLDVGCGLGDDVRALAARVGPGGRVVGVDVSETMLATARTQSAGLGLPVEFRAGDAHRLAFPDGSFDRVRCERVLEHLAEPLRAFAELVRVTRPGGTLVVINSDAGTYALDHPDPERTRAVLLVMGARHAHPWMGRQLYGLFRAAGLTELQLAAQTHFIRRLDTSDQGTVYQAARQAVAQGVLTPDEAAAWLAPLEEADRAGRFLSTGTHFIVGGQKPVPPAP